VDINTDFIKELLLLLPVVLVALVFHELAHAIVSYKLGDPTPKNEGRLTLNPLKHLDPVGAICLLLFHFGWAKPVCINPKYYKNPRMGIILVSLAGPITNFCLAFLSIFIFGLINKFATTDSTAVYYATLYSLNSAILNVGLGLFNLIPIPPLDGSKVLIEGVPAIKKLYYKYYRYTDMLRFILLILLFTNVLTTPLIWLNDTIVNAMWSVVRLILMI